MQDSRHKVAKSRLCSLAPEYTILRVATTFTTHLDSRLCVHDHTKEWRVRFFLRSDHQLCLRLRGRCRIAYLETVGHTCNPYLESMLRVPNQTAISVAIGGIVRHDIGLSLVASMYS